MWIVLSVLIFWMLILLAFAYGFAVYRFAFYHPMEKRVNPWAKPGPGGQQDHWDIIRPVIDEMDKDPSREVSIVARDGCRLYGRMYDTNPGAPMVIFFHGYHGTRFWDGHGAYCCCKKYHYNILMVDQRAHGKSESNLITFGIRERYDCKAWADYVAEKYGPEQKIVLMGVSMGAATVMMASNLDLPENVKGIVEDCGYSSIPAILKRTAKDMGFPVGITYALARVIAKLVGRFDPEEVSPLEAVSHTKLPILFLHGTEDEFVSPSMCEELYQACSGPKKIAYMDGAGHAMSGIKTYSKYEKVVGDFLAEIF